MRETKMRAGQLRRCLHHGHADACAPWRTAKTRDPDASCRHPRPTPFVWSPPETRAEPGAADKRLRSNVVVDSNVTAAARTTAPVVGWSIQARRSAPTASSEYRGAPPRDDRGRAASDADDAPPRGNDAPRVDQAQRHECGAAGALADTALRPPRRTSSPKPSRGSTRA
jgi:hypothetical protein